MSEIDAVVFYDQQQELYGIFGSEEVHQRFREISEVSVMIFKSLHLLPDAFFQLEEVRNQGHMEKVRAVLSDNNGGEFNVLFLPWVLMPKEFNVISPDHPAQK